MRHDSTGRTFAPESIAAQALGWVDAETRAIVSPIHPSTTFLRDPDNQYRSGRVYGRSDNPTFDQAEALVTSLEGGASSMLFASGMAAATAVFLSLSPGDHVVVPEVMYWSLRSWICGPGERLGLRASVVDMSNPEKVAAAIEPDKTRLVWVETPANPLWGVTDIAEVSRLAHAAGALVCVDSTSATPVLTRPLAWGADFVMHSATKYLNGHSDVLAGTLTAARTGEFWERVRATRSQVGSIAGPFEAWLLVRGMRTLFLRVRAASKSALAIAEHLEPHPRVLSVMYPGLSSFPTHVVAARQMDGGFGGMLSVRIRGGEEAAVRVASRVSLWKRATSLGGVESLIEHRSSVEGPDSPVPRDLLRLSVGIEAAADLIADLDQALAL
ncbi:trans-sulfuration enzyme family protein [Polyangium mundeleinium]|uniref:Aminotransferase class I/II-fold pyridoxal phosphate-dependent enzyme n=1 Tax=Polyangium mundeleinium TaxID=2995306 RepID=A0ABT5EMV3_9BACT|nr:aminotransferase class I/II-fold pyridoxal phosphate-dependent enzyme [Polyangium mundeleinium]MDC0742046.1 aminotransferase class I/II-fold pyridoxal phosphate-dependent enzyme [Polyangium mundeleinium]